MAGPFLFCKINFDFEIHLIVNFMTSFFIQISEQDMLMQFENVIKKLHIFEINSD